MSSCGRGFGARSGVGVPCATLFLLLKGVILAYFKTL